MIPASELRIGNWVSCELEGETQYVRITANDFVAYMLKPIDFFKPMPLTVDLLNILGFIYSEKRDNYYIEYEIHGNQRVFVVRLDDKMGWFCYVHDKVTFDSVSLCLTPSLHTLQNVFFYCTMQELEITL